LGYQPSAGLDIIFLEILKVKGYWDISLSAGLDIDFLEILQERAFKDKRQANIPGLNIFEK